MTDSNPIGEPRVLVSRFEARVMALEAEGFRTSEAQYVALSEEQNEIALMKIRRRLSIAERQKADDRAYLVARMKEPLPADLHFLPVDEGDAGHADEDLLDHEKQSPGLRVEEE